MASEKGRLYKRGRTWWVQVYDHDGRRVRFSTGTRDKREADRLLNDKLAELNKGRPVIGPPRITVGQLLQALEDDYKVKGRASMDRLKSARGHLEAFFTPSKKAVAIRGGDLQRYLLHRTEGESASMQTVRYELAMLRRAFVLQQRMEVLDRIPVFPEFEAASSRDTYVPDGDHRAIVAQLDDPVSHLVTFLYWTGWRVGARGDEGALNLTWDDVDWSTGSLRVGSGSKTKKPGRFYFDAVPEVEGVLRALRGRNEAWVFARANGRRLGYKFALQAFKDAQEKAGVGPYRLHDYRRSVARRLEQGGIPRSTAMRITGHRTEHVFRQYAVGEDEDVRKALRLTAGTVLGTIEGAGGE
jgi:integrase